MADFQSLVSASVSYEAFVSQGSADEIRQLRIEQEKTAQPGFLSAEEEAAIRDLSGDYLILAAAEMWCPDCQRNMPAIQALCQRYPDAQLAVITRAQAETVFKAHFGLDKVKIPFAVVLDAALTPLGAFVERPQSLPQDDAAELQAYKRGERLADTVREVVAIMQHPA